MEDQGAQGNRTKVAAASTTTSFTSYGFDPLMGRYPTVIEPNGRVILPAALRYPYGDRVAVMPGGEKYLMIQTPEVAQMVIKQMKRDRDKEFVPPRLSKRSYTETKYAPVDKQFRFVIPPDLRQAVGITEEIVICGAGECIEIWSAEQWEINERPYVGETALYFETFDGLE